MAFSGARTYHRMACAIEDAGFVLHSMIGWVYGSGFPKATRIDTQVDRAAGAERTETGGYMHGGTRQGGIMGKDLGQVWHSETAPATPLASTWSGHRYGLQALKPALEPICVFQKPYAGRPVDSITEYGAGALWIEGARVDGAPRSTHKDGNMLAKPGCVFNSSHPDDYLGIRRDTPAGRWPSNLILQHAPGCRRVGVKRVKGSDRPGHEGRTSTAHILSETPLMHSSARHADSDGYETVDEWQCVEGCAAAALGRMSGELKPRANRGPSRSTKDTFGFTTPHACGSECNHNDTGTAARFFQQCDWALEEAEPFFYCAKASRRERDSGLGQMVTPRRDLTQEQRAWLYAELDRRGVSVSSVAQGQEHE